MPYWTIPVAGRLSEKSAETLVVEGSDTNLTITKIHETRSATTKAIEGVAVANIKEDATLDLPRTFTPFQQTATKYHEWK